MFEGSYVALITPMYPDGAIDVSALESLVEWHIENGTHGIVAMGTTGESPTLTMEEHCNVLEIVATTASGKIKVIAGCGSNNTAEALHFHCRARSLQVDAALHVTGYYNRPSQEGIYQHFLCLSRENELPIIVYNVPHRTVVDISVETMVRLSGLPAVIGVKDASQDLTRPALERLSVGPRFSLLSGEDASAVAYNAAGGNGCISVTANVAPGHCAEMQSACLQGNYPAAMEIQSKLLPLHMALFSEPSPAGIKYACSQSGLCGPTTRLPMIELQESTKRKIDRAMELLGL